MNERDSEEVLGMLAAQGYAVAEQAEAADVILLNTCSVRGHAEERAFGKMGELSELKRDRPELVLGIIGCMAKLHQERIFKRLPAVDLIAGPAELYDLPYLLAEIQEKRQREVHGSGFRVHGKSTGPRTTNHEPRTKVMAVGRAFRPLSEKPEGDYRKPGVRAFVTIMEGCDKACTYCIVPTTRGQEISRPAHDIIEEITRLVMAGYQEITLLGQNVNSYGKRFPDGSGYKGPLGRLRLPAAPPAGERGAAQAGLLEEEPETLLDFPQLLRMIDASLQIGDSPHSGRRTPTAYGAPVAHPASGGVPGLGRSPLPRIRFTTSHPFDATERLFAAMRDCDSVCESLHLPVQSGSNRLLRAMRRGYTAEAYLKKIEALRREVPEIALSTDIIVGFPGETEDDFQATVRLMREVEYDYAYLFKYSPRPGTDAAAWEDDVPQEMKDTRHRILQALQGEASLARHRRWEGREAEILLEARGRFERQWFGRTRGSHGVIVESPEDLLGKTVQAKITRGTVHTLFGDVISCHVSSRLSDPPR